MVRHTVQFPFRLGGLVLAVSCVQPVDAPELVSMDPAWGWNGETTDVVLLGNDFYPGIAATGSDRFEIDRQFDAWLTLEGNRTPLEGVSLQELDALSARVPAGLEPGRYDVGLRTPNGVESILARGFSVT
ncbi:MAG: hypothetical protein VX265_15915, partial [Myxococcota bacterium]|nr:hypothetical protein [Myxococcota bacterium]